MKTVYYKDLYTYRQRSVLPPELQTGVYMLGKAIDGKTISQRLIDEYRNALQCLSASVAPSASDEFRTIAAMYQGYHNPAQTRGLHARVMSILNRNATIPDLLKSYPDLGWLVLFHGNGYLRQAALENLKSAPQSEFEFAAIVYRMNDWVENVRGSAEHHASKFFPKTNPDIIGEAAFFLQGQASTLSRWSDQGQKILEASICSPEVLAYMKNQFLVRRSGRVGCTLSQVLMRADFDQELEDVARNAVLPSVRAVSMDALLHSRARWFIGYKNEWENKPLGISRRVAVFETRPIKIETDFEALLQVATIDRCAQVRKVAADALIARRRTATPKMNDLAKILRDDKNSRVRSRADFYLRKCYETI